MRHRTAQFAMWFMLASLFSALFAATMTRCTHTNPTPFPTDTVTTVTPTPTPAPPLPPDTVRWFCATPDFPPGKKLASLNGRTWPNGTTLRIGFIGGTEEDRKRIKDAYGEISRYANLRFTYPASGTTDIRWGFQPGYGAYSYIGTDCKQIQQSVSTGNIGFRNDGISVEIHEAMHSVGFIHEQSSPNANICWNKDQVYKDLGGAPNYWSRATVDANVFARYLPSQANASIYDPLSIMQYAVKNTWTCDGKGISGGVVLSPIDKLHLPIIYPGIVNPPPPPPSGGTVTIRTGQRDSLLLYFNRSVNETAAGNAYCKKVFGIQ